MSCVLAVGVGLCDCAWQGAEGGSPCPPSPSPTGCLTRSAHTFGAMAAGARDGGEGDGGSKIKLKIKACPESPSAPHRAGRWGGAHDAAAPPPQPLGLGPSVHLSSGSAKLLPGPIAPGRRPYFLPGSISNQWGQGGARGMARSKGSQERDTGTERETWR